MALIMIRNACGSDFNAVFDLENQVFQLHLNARPDLIKPKLSFNQEYFSKCIQDDKMNVLVFEENETILGYCITQVVEHKDHHVFYDMIVLEIRDMCVDEKARGRDIGRQLFDRAKDYAKEIGAHSLELSVWGFNRNARQFYEHLGMSERVSRMEMIIDYA